MFVGGEESKFESAYIITCIIWLEILLILNFRTCNKDNGSRVGSVLTTHAKMSFWSILYYYSRFVSVCGHLIYAQVNINIIQKFKINQHCQMVSSL